MRIPRTECLAQFREKIERGEPLIGAGVGCGLSARGAVQGGADFLVVYHSGRYRTTGHGSLAGLMPFGDANESAMEVGIEVMPVADNLPVLVSVCGTDPFRTMSSFLKTVRDSGYTGVQNYPTVGVIDGVFRQNLEEIRLGYAREVEMIHLARQMDLLTIPFVFTPEEARAMADAGADILVAHLGLVSNGPIGGKKRLTIDGCVKRIQKIHDAARERNDSLLLLCHGGPLIAAEDICRVVAKAPGVVGYLGASGIERLPVEVSVANTVRELKTMPLNV